MLKKKIIFIILYSKRYPLNTRNTIDNDLTHSKQNRFNTSRELKLHYCDITFSHLASFFLNEIHLCAWHKKTCYKHLNCLQWLSNIFNRNY